MIQIENVTKKFDDFTALDELSCTINNGCIYGMVGTNGAGKSTLLRLLAGVYYPTSGNVMLDGKPVYDNIENKNKIAFVPDELFFLPGANIKRMGEFFQSIYPNFDNKRFDYLVKQFELDDKKAISKFSKGMKRQAAIILALSTKPEYLFFDETYDGLDPVMRNLVKKVICEDVMERKATAIITSHSLRELEDSCDLLSLLHKGKLVLESDVQNLKTSLSKVQIAFTTPYDKEIFDGIEIVNYKKSGCVANVIVRGNQDEIVAKLSSFNPVILEVLPLTLEEVFVYETANLGYSFEQVVENMPL